MLTWFSLINTTQLCYTAQFKCLNIMDQHYTPINYHSFIYYSGSYMFRHLYVVQLNHLYVVQLDNITHQTTTTSAHRLPTFTVRNYMFRHLYVVQPDNITHQTTTTSAHRLPTFTVHDYNVTIAAFQVTRKDTGRSLKMAHECRNM
jgi:hypothetical protein